MNFATYAQEAKRTRRPNLLKEQYLANYGMGIAEEAIEVMEVVGTNHYYMNIDNLLGKVINEAGDVCWYASELCSVAGIDHQSIFNHAKTLYHNDNSLPTFPIKHVIIESSEELVLHAGRVCGYLKKVVFQGHVLSEDLLQEHLAQALAKLFNLLQVLNIKFETVLEANIEKLKKRYPQNFQVELSINREE